MRHQSTFALYEVGFECFCLEKSEYRACSLGIDVVEKGAKELIGVVKVLEDDGVARALEGGEVFLLGVVGIDLNADIVVLRKGVSSRRG